MNMLHYDVSTFNRKAVPLIFDKRFSFFRKFFLKYWKSSKFLAIVTWKHVGFSGG